LAVRCQFPWYRKRIFRVKERSRSGFAARSVRFVRELHRVGGVLVSFPGRACPRRLSPSADSRACFCGTGSGSWATLSLAAGLGVPCLVWLPGQLVVPARFGFVSLGSGWWWFAG